MQRNLRWFGRAECELAAGIGADSAIQQGMALLYACQRSLQLGGLQLAIQFGKHYKIHARHVIQQPEEFFACIQRAGQSRGVHDGLSAAAVGLNRMI
jgi:hypothetical protein